MLETLFILLLIVVSSFMIVLILIQRGKGGGLAGAFGGMGGQSAFGTKAGDLFTRITVVTACIWFVLCISTVWYLKHGMSSGVSGSFGSGSVPATSTTSGSPTDSTAPVATPGAAPSAPASTESAAPVTVPTAPAPVAPTAPAGSP